MSIPGGRAPESTLQHSILGVPCREPRVGVESWPFGSVLTGPLQAERQQFFGPIPVNLSASTFNLNRLLLPHAGIIHPAQARNTDFNPKKR